MSNQYTKILDEDGNWLFSTAISMSVSVSPSKTFSTHTLENSSVVTDDQFDNPTVANVQLILDSSDYVSTYKSIKSYYEAVTNFSLQTRVDVYDDMYLDGIPHEENPNMFNTISMNLTFTQQIISTSDTETLSTTDVSSTSDASTTSSGKKSTTSDDDGSILSTLYSRAFD